MAFWNKKDKPDLSNGEDGDNDFEKAMRRYNESKEKPKVKVIYVEKKPEEEREKSEEEISDEEYFKADPELFGNWMSRSSMERHDDFTSELKESLMTQEELEAKRREEQKSMAGGVLSCPYCRRSIVFENASEAGKELDNHIAKAHPDKRMNNVAKERIKLNKVI